MGISGREAGDWAFHREKEMFVYIGLENKGQNKGMATEQNDYKEFQKWGWLESWGLENVCKHC